MRSTPTTVIATYASATQAEEAVEKLLASQIQRDQIGLVAANADCKLTNNLFETTRVRARELIENKEREEREADESALEDSFVGAAIGAGSGTLWALGIAAGILPAIGPVVAGGLLGALVASAGSGAAAGGLVGSLVALGLEEDEASHLNEQVEQGRTIVVVKNVAEVLNVKSILSTINPLSLWPASEQEQTLQKAAQ